MDKIPQWIANPGMSGSLIRNEKNTSTIRSGVKHNGISSKQQVESRGILNLGWWNVRIWPNECRYASIFMEIIIDQDHEAGRDWLVAACFGENVDQQL